LLNSKKGIVSLEFLLAILVIILTLSILITINLYFKNKLENTNYNNSNKEICYLKQIIIEKNNGVLKQNDCKEIKSTNNDS